MIFSQAQAALKKHFATGWGSTTKVAWPDVPFKPPSGAVWVRFNATETDGYQASMGSPTANTFRHFGVITVQIFAPLGKAAVGAHQKADTALALYQGEEYQGIHFYNAQVRDIGDDGHGWYQVNVSVLFRYDELT